MKRLTSERINVSFNYFERGHLHWAVFTKFPCPRRLYDNNLFLYLKKELDKILEQERTEIEKVQREVDMLSSDNEELTEEQLDELEAQVQ